MATTSTGLRARAQADEHRLTIQAPLLSVLVRDEVAAALIAAQDARGTERFEDRAVFSTFVPSSWSSRRLPDPTPACSVYYP